MATVTRKIKRFDTSPRPTVHVLTADGAEKDLTDYVVTFFASFTDTLRVDIDDIETDVKVTVASMYRFKVGQQFLVGQEKMTVTAVDDPPWDTDSVVTVTRGAETTTPYAHTAGDTIRVLHVEGSGQFVNPPGVDGRIEYEWGNNDLGVYAETGEVGTFTLEFELVHASEGKITVPVDDTYQLTVVEDLDYA